jgi:hypothetical protein
MNNKEKYYQHIITDLYSKLRVNYRLGLMYHVYNNDSSILGADSFGPPNTFKKYLIEKYGVHESEIDQLWRRYKEKLPRSY